MMGLHIAGSSQSLIVAGAGVGSYLISLTLFARDMNWV